MATYHPIFSGLWNDDALEGLCFEAKGFFAFLCSNDHVRPSGIYRVTDQQLAEETRLRVRRVREYLEALSVRGRIIRDGLWIFICGYFKRQPKQERLLIGARNDVNDCSSEVILKAFAVKYPYFNRWSEDRLKTISLSTASFVSPMQSNAEQSNAMQSSRPSGDLSLTKGRTKAPTQAPAKGQYLEIIRRIEAEHPELPKSEAAVQALAELQRELKR
jgi:hypothetical protein